MHHRSLNQSNGETYKEFMDTYVSDVEIKKIHANLVLHDEQYRELMDIFDHKLTDVHKSPPPRREQSANINTLQDGNNLSTATTDNSSNDFNSTTDLTRNNNNTDVHSASVHTHPSKTKTRKKGIYVCRHRCMIDGNKLCQSNHADRSKRQSHELACRKKNPHPQCVRNQCNVLSLPVSDSATDERTYAFWMVKICRFATVAAGKSPSSTENLTQEQQIEYISKWGQHVVDIVRNAKLNHPNPTGKGNYTKIYKKAVNKLLCDNDVHTQLNAPHTYLMYIEHIVGKQKSNSRKQSATCTTISGQANNTSASIDRTSRDAFTTPTTTAANFSTEQHTAINALSPISTTLTNTTIHSSLDLNISASVNPATVQPICRMTPSVVSQKKQVRKSDKVVYKANFNKLFAGHSMSANNASLTTDNDNCTQASADDASIDGSTTDSMLARHTNQYMYVNTANQENVDSNNISMVSSADERMTTRSQSKSGIIRPPIVTAADQLIDTQMAIMRAQDWNGGLDELNEIMLVNKLPTDTTTPIIAADVWEKVYSKYRGKLTCYQMTDLMKKISINCVSQYTQLNTYDDVTIRYVETPVAIFLLWDIVTGALRSGSDELMKSAIHQLLQMLKHLYKGKAKQRTCWANYNQYMKTKRDEKKLARLWTYAQLLYVAQEYHTNEAANKSVSQYIDQCESHQQEYRSLINDCFGQWKDNLSLFRAAISSYTSQFMFATVTAIDRMTADIVFIGILDRLNATKFKDCVLTMNDILMRYRDRYDKKQWLHQLDVRAHPDYRVYELQAYHITHSEFAQQGWGINTKDSQTVRQLLHVERKHIVNNMQYYMAYRHYEVVGEFVVALQRMHPNENERRWIAAGIIFLILHFNNDLMASSNCTIEPDQRFQVDPKTNLLGHTAYCVTRALLPW